MACGRGKKLSRRLYFIQLPCSSSLRTYRNGQALAKGPAVLPSSYLLWWRVEREYSCSVTQETNQPVVLLSSAESPTPRSRVTQKWHEKGLMPKFAACSQSYPKQVPLHRVTDCSSSRFFGATWKIEKNYASGGWSWRSTFFCRKYEHKEVSSIAEAGRNVYCRRIRIKKIGVAKITRLDASRLEKRNVEKSERS